jgi:hypothetical protein
MNRKSYLLATAIVFSVIGLLHLLRIILGWEAAIAGWTVPMWLSWLALIVSAAFASLPASPTRGPQVEARPTFPRPSGGLGRGFRACWRGMTLQVRRLIPAGSALLQADLLRPPHKGR